MLVLVREHLDPGMKLADRRSDLTCLSTTTGRAGRTRPWNRESASFTLDAQSDTVVPARRLDCRRAFVPIRAGASARGHSSDHVERTVGPEDGHGAVTPIRVELDASHTFDEDVGRNPRL